MTKSTTAATIRSELDSLRREIEAIRAGRKKSNGNGDTDFGLDLSAITDQLRTLTQDVTDFAEEAGEAVERKVTSHPLTSVLGALLADHYGVAFISPNHSADYVEVTALGPGADAVGGLMDNIDLHAVMVSALALAPGELLPDMRDKLKSVTPPKSD